MLRTDFTPSFARDRKRCIKKHWDVPALANMPVRRYLPY